MISFMMLALANLSKSFKSPGAEMGTVPGHTSYKGSIKMPKGGKVK